MVAGLIAAFALLFVAMCNQSPGREEVVVFAAASLTDVMGELTAQFEEAYPDVDVIVSLGASSTLARQIQQQAPADVFFSASPVWTEYLAEENLLRAPARVVIGNRLVVIGPEGAMLLGSLDDLLDFTDIALADPASAPAGQYAREGFERAGLWEDIEPRTIPTMDVRAAVAAVQTGAAEAAVVYASDVRGVDGVRVLLDWPEAFQPPIRYTIAVPRTTRHPNRAFEFVEFVRQPERNEVWRRFGFVPLGETLLP